MLLEVELVACRWAVAGYVMGHASHDLAYLSTVTGIYVQLLFSVMMALLVNVS